jgi:hypothetical protein
MTTRGRLMVCTARGDDGAADCDQATAMAVSFDRRQGTLGPMRYRVSQRITTATGTVDCYPARCSLRVVADDGRSAARTRISFARPLGRAGGPP